jgi:hypothetical protein
MWQNAKKGRRSSMETAEQVLALTEGAMAQQERGVQKALIRRWLRYWHPDVNAHPRAADVFAHVVGLRDALIGATGATRRSSAARGGVLACTVEGVRVGYAWTRQESCLVGRRYVGKRSVAWVYEERDWRDAAAACLRSLPYADDKMRMQGEKMFPTQVRVGETQEGAPMLVVVRRGAVILEDWLSQHGGMPPAHLAWLGSGLLNMAAWASWAGWSLPGLGVDTVAIDPRAHVVSMLGGWEMAHPLALRPKVLPGLVLDLFPALAAPGVKSHEGVMGECVRQCLRRAAGAGVGQDLEALGVPPAMARWIEAPPAVSGRADYQAWYGALEKDFGKRKFVRWDKKIDDVPGYG